MRHGLFILSLSGFAATGYNLAIELREESSTEYIIYIFLLAILLCNCALGIVMTCPKSFAVKRRLKLAGGRYPIRK